MKKKKKQIKPPKTDRFTILTSEEATLAQMPKYNGYATGHGAHGQVGYDRKRQKKELDRLIDESKDRS